LIDWVSVRPRVSGGGADGGVKRRQGGGQSTARQRWKNFPPMADEIDY